MRSLRRKAILGLGLLGLLGLLCGCSLLDWDGLRRSDAPPPMADAGTADAGD